MVLVMLHHSLTNNSSPNRGSNVPFCGLTMHSRQIRTMLRLEGIYSFMDHNFRFPNALTIYGLTHNALDRLRLDLVVSVVGACWISPFHMHHVESGNPLSSSLYVTTRLV